MSIEPIGIALLVIGLICMLRGYRATAYVFVLSTALGAAAAALIGENNLTPAHVFLGFLFLSVLFQRDAILGLIDAFRPPSAGFWLMCLVVYGLLGAFFFPRLFSGATYIIPLSGVGSYDIDPVVPLQPVSSNFTHSVYMIGNLFCFGLAYAIARKPQGFETLTRAVTALAIANVAFALLDIATYATGTASLMDFMRNTDYHMHANEEVQGLKRIVGSYVETSVFARVSLGLFGFTATMWLCGRQPYLHGILSLALLALVALSTSSTGLAGMPVMLAVLYFTAFQLSLFHQRPASSITVVFAPILAFVLLFAILLMPSVAGPIQGYIDDIVLNKLDSQSGVERSMWNAVAFENFKDTWGVGVGLGTTRSSSLLLAILSNTGVLGLIFYMMFCFKAFARSPLQSGGSAPAGHLAARNACLGFLVGDLVSSSALDQGLLFYLLAALAAAAPVRMAAPSPVFRPQPVGT